MSSELDLTFYIHNRLADVEIFSELQSSRNIEPDSAFSTASNYSQAKNAATAHLSELNLILHLLESVTSSGRTAPKVKACQVYKF